MSGKIPLNDTVVAKLKITQKPVLKDGKLSYIDNPEGKPYIVFDSGSDSPIGFGVKVGAKTKTYIIQRRKDSRVIKAKVGAVKDFAVSGGIVAAREKARELSKELLQSGRNPNVARRHKLAGQLTLGEVFDRYLAHLKSRPQPATDNTIKVLRAARKRVESWDAMPVKELRAQEIIERFDEIAAKTRTAAEQTFRWCTAATNYVLQVEMHEAQQHKREPSLSYNPFTILHINKSFRTRAQLDNAYEAKQVRNPLSRDETLGNFLNALWDRRPANRTGCDYLLLLLLWGCRKSESACLKWKELLTPEEAAVNSWVDLKKGIVRFYKTKNGRPYRLPLTDAASEILKQRQELLAERMDTEKMGKRRFFVFPAVSPESGTGHYSDAGTLLDYIRQDAGIDHLTQHDFRRTFGRVAESLQLPELAIKKLMNHQADGITERYTDPEWREMKKRMQRMEDAILAAAPRVYNALKPSTKPPMHDDGKWKRRPQRRNKTTNAEGKATGSEGR